MNSPRRMFTAATLALGMIAATAAVTAVPAQAATPVTLASVSVAAGPDNDQPKPPPLVKGNDGKGGDDNKGHDNPGPKGGDGPKGGKDWPKGDNHDKGGWDKKWDNRWDHKWDRDWEHWNWNWDGDWRHATISPELCRDGHGHVDWNDRRCRGGYFDGFRIRT